MKKLALITTILTLLLGMSVHANSFNSETTVEACEQSSMADLLIWFDQATGTINYQMNNAGNGCKWLYIQISNSAGERVINDTYFFNSKLGKIEVDLLKMPSGIYRTKAMNKCVEGYAEIEIN